VRGRLTRGSGMPRRRCPIVGTAGRLAQGPPAAIADRAARAALSHDPERVRRSCMRACSRRASSPRRPAHPMSAASPRGVATGRGRALPRPAAARRHAAVADDLLTKVDRARR
jgi:hypothetical protein